MYESSFIPWLYDGEPRQASKNKLPELKTGKSIQGDITAPKSMGILGGNTEIAEGVPKFTDAVTKIGLTDIGNKPKKKKAVVSVVEQKPQYPLQTPDGIVVPMLSPQSIQMLMEKANQLGLLGQPANPYDTYIQGGYNG